MGNLFRFIVKYHFFLMFLLLEGMAVFLISQSSYFRYSATLAKIDAAKGSTKKIVDGWKNYFDLQTKNQELLKMNLSLLDENIYLKIQLEMNKYNDIQVLKRFNYIPANVIENTLTRPNNKLILDIGKNHGVVRDMGVISLDGVVGIVDRVHDKYCTVTSLLNTSRNVNGKLKKSGQYGPLRWDRKDIQFIEMVDIPQHVPIEKGDSVVTSGHSLTFPEGIFIGTVDSYRIDNGASYKIKIKLNNDFQSLYHVYVIDAENKKELDLLKEELKKL
jgi:rod shape-determining protein MreC